MRAENGNSLTSHRRASRVARFGLAALAAVFLGSAQPAAADVVFTLNGGYLMLSGEDSRDEDDVLYQNAGFLAFEVEDFNGFTFGGDLHFGLGRYFEAGAGIGYYQQTVTTVYRDYVDASGFEVVQDLKMKQMPISFTGRVFPLGRDQPVQPYVGGGVALVGWRYSEEGEFIDFNNRGEIFRDRFVDDGYTAAPVAVAGIRFGGSNGFGAGGEFRYQGGKADLDPSEGFAGDKLDLGNISFLFTMQFRF